MGIESKISEWIKTWEGRDYSGGIPDEADHVLESFGKVPSYRRIVRAILKNDACLTTLGFSRPQCEIYNALKRAEIQERNERIPSDTRPTQTHF
jgi:predicted phosphoadenosine phosphosulfate sulfurtransferase